MSAHARLATRPWIGQVVRFTDGVLEDETVFEPGMLGCIVQAEIMHDDDVWMLSIETRPFDCINDPLMPQTYYDANGVPCLTARDAGFWDRAHQTYYLGAPPTWHDRMVALGHLDRPVHAWSMRKVWPVFSLFASEADRHADTQTPLSADEIQALHRCAGIETTARSTTAAAATSSSPRDTVPPGDLPPDDDLD